MSQENVNLVVRAIEAFRVGGVEATLRFYPSDVLWHPFPEWVESTEYRGYDGVRRVTGIWTDNLDDFAVELEEVRDLGDRVLVLGYTTGQIKETGVPFRQPLGVVFSDFREGKVGEAHHFATWAEALADAGLQE